MGLILGYEEKPRTFISVHNFYIRFGWMRCEKFSNRHNLFIVVQMNTKAENECAPAQPNRKYNFGSLCVFFSRRLTITPIRQKFLFLTTIYSQVDV